MFGKGKVIFLKKKELTLLYGKLKKKQSVDYRAEESTGQHRLASPGSEKVETEKGIILIEERKRKRAEIIQTELVTIGVA